MGWLIHTSVVVSVGAIVVHMYYSGLTISSCGQTSPTEVYLGLVCLSSQEAGMLPEQQVGFSDHSQKAANTGSRC